MTRGRGMLSRGRGYSVIPPSHNRVKKDIMGIKQRNTNKDKRIFFAVRDYYNDNSKRVNQIALHLTGRRKLKDLTEEEKSDIWAIRENMADKVYMNGF